MWSYALTFVYSNKERPSLLFIGPGSPIQIWLNGDEVYSSDMGLPMRKQCDAFSPVLLRTGRNILLVKLSDPQSDAHLRVRFDDWPEDRAAILGPLGLWNEALEALTRAQERGTLTEEIALRRLWVRASLGDAGAYRRDCAAVMRRFESSNYYTPWSCWIVAVGLGLRADSGAPGSLLRSLAERDLEGRDVQKEPWSALPALLAAYRSGYYSRVLDLAARYFPTGEPFPSSLPVLAMAHHRLGHSDQARVLIKRAEQDFEAPSENFDQGLSPFSEYWPDKSVDLTLLREAYLLIEGKALEPSADLAAIMARGRSALQNLDPLTAAYDQAVMLEPGVAWYRLARARRLADLQRWEKAEIDFRKAIELNPGDRDLKKACRMYLIKAGRQTMLEQLLDPTRIAALLDSAVKMSPENASRWVSRGRFHAESRMFQKAATDFARAFELAPDSGILGRQSAVMFLSAGDLVGYRRACKQLEQTFRKRNDAEAAHQWVMALLERQDSVDDWRPVIVQAEESLSLHKTNPEMHFALAAALLRGGRYDDALRKLDEADRLEWNASILGKQMKSIVLARLGRIDEAQLGAGGSHKF